MIQISNLTKKYGPNGAGKSTLIASILGIVSPTTGSIHVLGEPVPKNQHLVSSRINFSSPYYELPHSLTVMECLCFFGRIYGIRKPSTVCRSLIDRLGLGEYRDQNIGQLSSGGRARVNIAKSLVNSPEILFLDEPTASLDPATTTVVQEILTSYQTESGTTLVFSSHNMSEV